jgi:hypothetical protein
VAGLGLVIARSALARRLPLEPDWVNRMVVLWILAGSLRVWSDTRTYGVAALRDFATIYYAAYFFIAQAAMLHPASARWLRRCALFASIALPIVLALYNAFPDFFAQTLLIRGTPLVYLKEDLVAAYCFVGFFLVLAHHELFAGWRATAIASVCYASAFTITSSRAAIIGLAVASSGWALARRWAPFKLQAVIIPLGILALALTGVLRDQDFQQTRLYSLYEHVASIVDVTGTGTYQTEARRYVGDNNRFRLAWWRSVAEETWHTNPFYGLGFGYDLADRFVRNYEFDLGDEFTTRSPHSIIFTAIGRMGLVGLTVLIGLFIAIAAQTARVAKALRRDASWAPTLGWWSASWVILISACLGVVLEGPMGAVVFWTFLGMANAATRTKAAAAAIDEASDSVSSVQESSPALHLTEPHS